MLDHADVMRNSSLPLSKVILCCTSVLPDERQALARKAQDMGGKHVLDLTSDVTHLICGDLYTPKYKYVARMRSDVKVMQPGWIDAMYTLWIKGDDINLQDFEAPHRFPTLAGLKISVTGIPDVAERKRIEDLVTEQAASYHPDLTKEVTHLLAAAPTGKKYDFALHNGIHIVAPEWLYDSLDRGMALEEEFYDPKLPREKLGQGAKPQPSSARVQITDYHGKRKIRRKAEEKLGSQSQSLWDDIMGQAGQAKPGARNQWADPADSVRSRVGKEEPRGPAAEVSRKTTVPKKTGIFSNSCFVIHGYIGKQESTIHNVLSSHDGTIVSSIQQLESSPCKWRFLLVPHETKRGDCPDISDNAKIVTDFWIEACLHKGEFVEPESIVLSAFNNFPLAGFEGMDICITGFTGIEVRHYSKLVTLLGASFHEDIKRNRSLLIIRAPTKSEKFLFAIEHGIPVVTKEWLEQCVEQSCKLEYGNFAIADRKKQYNAKQDQNSASPVPHNETHAGPKLPLGDKFKRKREEQGADTDDRGKRRRTPDSESESSNREKGKLPEQSKKAIGQRKSSSSADASTNRPLKECIVCISSHLKDRRGPLIEIAALLGATVVDQFSSDNGVVLTHLVHSSTTGISRDATKDVRAAKSIEGCFIVSPEWLYKCQKARQRVDEKSFLVIASSTRDSQMKPPLKGPSADTATVARKQTEELPNLQSASDTSKPSGSRENATDVMFPVPLSDRSNGQISSYRTALRESAEPPDFKRSSSDIGEILSKYGKEKLASALDQHKKPRGRLRGRALPGLSNFGSSLTSRTPSVDGGSLPGSQQQNSGEPPAHMGSDEDMGQEPDLIPSQAIGYADPEAEREKRLVLAKLSGATTPAKSPQSAKRRARLPPAVETPPSAVRRSKRRGAGAA